MNVYIKSIRFKTDKGLEEFINKKCKNRQTSRRNYPK